MLTRAIQVIPQQNTPFVANACVGPCLAAHGHLIQAEIHADGGTAAEKPLHRQQKSTWHIDRARAALHGVEGGMQAPTTLLLLHVHIVHAQVVMAAGVSSEKQAQKAFEELLDGCRCCASTDAEIADDSSSAQSLLAPQVAWD